MKKFLALSFLTLLFATVNATNYYISNDGSDSNSGTSTSSPWRTLDKLNSYFNSLRPGDNVYLNRGDVFYGTIRINSHSGASGSPITIGAYGSGANPVVTGFTKVTSWTNLGGNIWESSSAISSLSTCNIVSINGVNTPMGRYPNSGWLTYQSHSGTTSITSNQLSGSPNWTGAEAVTRIIRWVLHRDIIKSQSGGTVTIAGSGNTPVDGYGFFIQNDSRTLDVQNEWYFNPSTKKIRVYSSSTPSNVEVATIEELVLTSGSNYITFDHIDFRGSNSYLYENRYGKYITIQNCSFLFAGKIGLMIDGSVSASNIMTIDNNTFKDNNDNAMSLRSYSSYSWVKNNVIDNTGMIPGAGSNEQNSYDAIDVDGQNSLLEYNTIRNTGHIAIATRMSDGIVVRNNFISYFGMTKYDAGGIYSYNKDSTTVKSRIFDHNLVISSKLTSEGIGTDIPSCFGIYLDGDSKNTTITNNTVAHCKDGIHILNSGSCTITNNVSYDNSLQFVLLHAWGFGMKITGMVVKNNIFFSKSKSQPTFSFRDDDNILFTKFGSSDYNYFARPIDDNLALATQVNYDVTNRTVSGWQTLSGQDGHSKKSPKSISDENDLRFEYNATKQSKTISLPYNYIDVTGKSYNGSITLAPYTSAVLIKNGAATSSGPVVADAGNDQTITLPTNSVDLSGSGSGGSGGISAYQWQKVSGPSGSVISNSTSASTSVTGLVEGNYEFQLKVTDGAGASALDTVAVTVDAASSGDLSLLAAADPGSIVNGLNYSYYEAGSYSVVPSFNNLSPVKTGYVDNFDISVANRRDVFAFCFSGYIDIPADGQYTFYTNSDDGSKLYIDNVDVVDNDGIHPAKEKSGTIGLKAGKHTISLGYFEQTGSQILDVSYEGPGIGKRLVPSSSLYRVAPTNYDNGLNYSYYEGSFSQLPSFSTMNPVKTGTTSNFDISVANRSDRFAISFSGYIDVPASGKYTFYTTSDDGSTLYIDNALIVNNDFIHSSREKSGSVTLSAGRHAIFVGFFEYTGGQVLTVSYAGPGITKQIIPGSVLFKGSGTSGSSSLALDNRLSQTIASEPSIGIKAFPNPFTNYIQVDINGAAGTYELALIDVSGKVLWTRSGVKEAGSFTQSVNTSALQRGVYFLKVIQNDKSSVVKLLK